MALLVEFIVYHARKQHESSSDQEDIETTEGEGEGRGLENWDFGDEEVWNGREDSEGREEWREGGIRAGRVEERQLLSIANVESFERRVRDWQDGCSICRIEGRDGSGHTWQECLEGQEEREGIMQIWRRLGGIRMENFSGCFQC